MVGRVIAIRFNTLVIPAFLEYFYLTQFTVFTLTKRLFNPICNPFTFESIREQEGKPKINLIILVVLIAISEYLDKTVLNPGFGTWVKERDELLG